MIWFGGKIADALFVTRYFAMLGYSFSYQRYENFMRITSITFTEDQLSRRLAVGFILILWHEIR
jgi:hypothetical protein